MLQKTRTAAIPPLVVAGVIVLSAGCTTKSPCAARNAARQAARDAERAELVIRQARVDPFASTRAPRTEDPFEPAPTDPVDENPVAIRVSAPPPITIYGDLPNTSALAQPPFASLDETQNLQQISFAPVGADFDPVASSDAKRLFFSSTRHRPTADIYVQNVGASAVTQLTSDPAHDVMPDVSSDDQRVAFASNRHGSWDIFVMSAEGGQAIQVTSDLAHELHPTFSPDGQKIAYCRLPESGERWEIWVTDLSRPAAHTFLTYGLYPEWHPTDDRILFQRSRDRADRYFSLWTFDYINNEATAQTEVISSATAAVINPTWSPDGRFVACATVVQPDPEDPRAVPDSTQPFADIWVISADGRARTNLTGGFRFNSMPAWAADGRIFFVSDRAGHAAIWSLHPAQAIEVAGMEPPASQPSVADAQENDPED